MSNSTNLLLLPALVFGIASCSDDTTAAPPPNMVVPPVPDAATDARGSDPPPLPEAGTPGVEPLYLLDARISQPDFTATEYLTLTKNLESGEIGTTGSLEQPGYSRLYADPKTGYFVIGNAETKRMSRYDVSSDGKFVAGETLSFEGVGVTRFAYRAVEYVTSEKAYYRDLDNARIIVWNPKTMTLTGKVISIDGLLRTGRKPFAVNSTRAGKYLFTGIGWIDNDYTLSDPDGAVVRIDTEADEATVLPAATTGCVPDGWSVPTDDGNTYFFSEPYNRGLRGSTSKDCGLRIAKDGSTFDSTFLLDLGQRTGGKLAGGYASAGGGNLWISVRTSTVPGTDLDDTYGTGWQWAKVDPNGTAEPTIDTTLAPSRDGGIIHRVDGRSFISVSPDSPTTQLYELTATGFVTKAKVLTNGVNDIARIN